MNNRKKCLLLISFLCLILCFTTGCSNDEKKILGYWYCSPEDDDLIFYKGGVGKMPEIDLAFEWKIADGRLKIDFGGIYGSQIFDYTLKSDTLILKYDDEVDIYRRQD